MKNIALSDEGRKSFRNLIADIIKNNKEIAECFPNSYYGYVSESIEEIGAREMLSNIANFIRNSASMLNRFEVTAYRYTDGNRYLQTNDDGLTKCYSEVELAIEYAMSVYTRNDIDAVRVKDKYTGGTKLDISK